MASGVPGHRVPRALDGVRVLDMSGPSGQYCGKMFADLGAEVILVEPVGGSSVRRDGPFIDNQPHPERSIPFAYFNSGKRSISIDLDLAEGQEIFRKLVSETDVLIESEKPGVMARRGLDYVSLTAISPRLVMASITPFGQDGPYSQYESEDIVALALGGMLYLGGYPETSPIAAHGNQAYLAAAQFAAVAAMMGVWAAEAEGLETQGRHIDVSIQECVVMGMENAIQFYDLEGTVRRREAGQQRWAGAGVFDCADGQVYLMAGGIVPNQFRVANVRWLMEEGVSEAEQMLAKKWDNPDYQASDEAKQIFAELFAPFARARTKEYLYSEGQSRRIPICPINTPRDLMENRQLAYRNYFVSVAHSHTGKPLTVPGAPYVLGSTPWGISRPSPRLGEHTSEILSVLGYDIAAQAALLKSGVTN
ncbi:CaiB/BaiF CoA transferase family protein [Cupriavidus sp. CuC1]|uniref:CaiB/BaiF CoA transferase family protein n=1 Tax=Cupriavidus sp. CuC1 TaxID=3373131 RepID=UPI0037D83FB9